MDLIVSIGYGIKRRTGECVKPRELRGSVVENLDTLINRAHYPRVCSLCEVSGDSGMQAAYLFFYSQPEKKSVYISFNS